MLKIPQSLMPMLCRYKSIRPPNSHVDAFELNGTAELVAQLEAENATLRERIHEAKEIYIGMEGFVPVTAPEGYQQRILKQMWEALTTAPPTEQEQSAQPEGGE